jgi:hypothetical protein
LFALDPPWRRAIASIPLLWSIVGGSASILLGVRADLMLWVAGLALMGYLLKPTFNRPVARLASIGVGTPPRRNAPSTPR